MYYSMWEVHQLVTERRDSLLYDTQRVSLRRLLEEVPVQEREAWIDAVVVSEADTSCQLPEVSEHDGDRRAGNRWAWLAALLGHWHPRRAEVTQR
jgi:hypothetical protein